MKFGACSKINLKRLIPVSSSRFCCVTSWARRKHGGLGRACTPLPRGFGGIDLGDVLRVLQDELNLAIRI